MNRLTRLFGTGVLAAGAIGCMAPEPPPPPFDTSPFGPGIEVQGSGRRVDFLSPEGDLLGRFRDSGQSLRIYDESSVQLGRIRIARDGFELLQADGAAACVISVAGAAAHVSCDDEESGERDEVLALSIGSDGAIEIDVSGEAAGHVGELDDGVALFDASGQAILTRQSDDGGQVRLAGLDGVDTLVFGPGVSEEGALASFVDITAPSERFGLSPWLLRGALYFATSRLLEEQELAEGSEEPAE